LVPGQSWNSVRDGQMNTCQPSKFWVDISDGGDIAIATIESVF
jgi:hypothetical protein